MEFNAQIIFIEIITIFFTLAGGFGMIYRTWIKPFNERMSERDKTIIEMQGRIESNQNENQNRADNNQAALDRHEEECIRRVQLLHTKIDKLSEKITKLQVDLAAAQTK